MDAVMYKDMLGDNSKSYADKLGLKNDFVFHQAYIQIGAIISDWKSHGSTKIAITYYSIIPIEHLEENLDQQIFQLKRRCFQECK